VSAFRGGRQSELPERIRQGVAERDRDPTLVPELAAERQRLLTGAGAYATKMSAAQKSQANAHATTLDRYDNNQLC